MKLRPHHGMCLAFFAGQGYSGEFTAHMTHIQRRLHEEDPAVCLLPETDEICARCPNNREGVCTSAEKVERYDRAVLERCGIEAGAELLWSVFSALVDKHILSAGQRRELCGDCQWDSLCTGQSSPP